MGKRGQEGKSRVARGLCVNGWGWCEQTGGCL